MTRVGERLRVQRFGLPEARQLAGEIGHDKAALRALVRKLFGDDVEVGKRAQIPRVESRTGIRAFWKSLRTSWLGCSSRCV